MNKKRLGLLLALVLALSPVFGAVSFADEDCQHEDAYWITDRDDAEYEYVDRAYHHVTGIARDILYCPDCDTELEVEEYELDEEECHSYDEDGICEYCGYENDCPHKHTSTYYYNVEEVSYTSVDDRVHKMTGPKGSIIKELQCDDCYMTLDEEEVSEGVERHRYDEDGVCGDCGHVNACPHENTQEPYTRWENDSYESIDDTHHLHTGLRSVVAWCLDCETDAIIEPAVLTSEEENHWYDEDGICLDCGHVNECTHENMEEPTLFWNDVVYEPIDDDSHRATGLGQMKAYCPDCESWVVTETDVEIDEIQEHYYQNGECIFCEHKNPCKHPNLEGPYTDYWDWDDLEYTPVDDRYHRATGPGYTYTYCPDCGERDIIDEDVEYDELEEHFYEDGICEYCGHENECTHPNTINPHVSYDYDDVTFTPIDNLYHRITGNGYIVSYCPDCGTYVKGEEAEVDKKEKHLFWKGECEICGYHLQIDENVARIFGADRYTTSRKVADELKEKLNKDKFDAVILADGKNYPDALAGSYLSCLAEAPILLANPSQKRIDELQEYIKANLIEGGIIYILGGTGAVPDEIVAGLDDYRVIRLGGKDRYETNIKILKEAANYGTDYQMIVCTGKDFADSLSAAAVGKPILLVGKSLSQAQKEYLDEFIDPPVFCIIGGEGAVNKDIEKALKNNYGYAWRIAGKDRYETSVNVARSFFGGPAAGVLAYGKNFPDGLCGGALAAAVNGPLILTTTSKTGEAVSFAKEKDIHFGYVLGGESLISDQAAKSIFQLDSGYEIVVK